jgi:hypothetical protein
VSRNGCALLRALRPSGLSILLAERAITAERAGQKIAVEVKSFLSDSPSSDLMEAVGQYVTYRSWFARVEPAREVWLAVPTAALVNVFDDAGAMAVMQDIGLQLIVVDLATERVTEWITSSTSEQ